MHLNTLSPAEGSHKKARRVGRGIGSGLGKTCGKGHKGQNARAGARSTIGFEGGQMPFQRRVPKFGFVSPKSLSRQELRLSDLNAIPVDVVDFTVLRTLGIIRANTKTVKLINSGAITKVLTLKGIPATEGAKKAIIAAGGKVED